MWKTIFLLIIILFTTACSGNATVTPIPAAQPSPSPAPPSVMPCTLVGGSTSAAEALKASIDGDEHAIGPENAAVTIVVFSDFQCPFCAYVAGSIDHIRQVHPDQVRLVFQYLPLPDQYDKSLLAIQAAEAAALQGGFWQMHDLLFQRQEEWAILPVQDFPQWATARAAELGLDAALFQADLSSEAVQAIAQGAAPIAASIGQTSAPLIYINDTLPYSGPLDFPNLEQVVALTALSARQFTACPLMTVDPLRQYLAILQTARGEVVIQLYADRVPMAVNSFITLARSGWYDGVTFHKVTATVAQTGDPSGTGLGNPGYLFPLETAAGLDFDRAGVVALLNEGMDTNGSRFFITLVPSPELEGRYTIIGQVLSGMDILSSLTRREVLPGQYLPPGDEIIHITIEEK